MHFVFTISAICIFLSLAVGAVKVAVARPNVNQRTRIQRRLQTDPLPAVQEPIRYSGAIVADRI
jgi:hypothetical protein